MKDGHSLIVEVHQGQAMAHVEVVIPNAPEAETMTEMMDKNVVAYLKFYLIQAGMEKGFVNRLLSQTCDPSLLHEAANCKWDRETWVLTTPEDKESEGKVKMDQAKWWKNSFDEFMLGSKKSKEKQFFADPENMFDLDGEASVKSIHKRPGKNKGYEGSPGAPTFQVGRKKGSASGAEVEEVEESSLEKSVDSQEKELSGLSREDLIARLLKKTRVDDQSLGSAPNMNKRSCDDPSDEGESSSDDDSSSSSDSLDSSGESAEEGLSGTESG